MKFFQWLPCPAYPHFVLPVSLIDWSGKVAAWSGLLLSYQQINRAYGFLITLMMEAISACETLTSFFETTWWNIPEESCLCRALSFSTFSGCDVKHKLFQDRRLIQVERLWQTSSIHLTHFHRILQFWPPTKPENILYLIFIVFVYYYWITYWMKASCTRSKNAIESTNVTIYAAR